MNFRKLQIACSIVSALAALALFAYWLLTPHLGIQFAILIALLVRFAAEPFLRSRWRFSLGTLFVVMTVVALVFGLVTYAVK